MRNFIKVADPNPGIKVPLLLGWTGMRGVISIAAALSIPVTMDNGQAFPHRDLILFITFVVILVTLILQGLTLPSLIKKLKLSENNGTYLSEKEAEDLLRKGMLHTAFTYLKSNHEVRKEENEYFRKLMNRLEQQDREDSVHKLSDEAKEIYVETMEEQRKWLREENRRNPSLN